MHPNDDILLAESCVKGIRSAQQFLYQKYAKTLYAIAFRYLGNGEEARDLLHDCFIKIFDKIGLYNGNGSLEGWLKRLLVNECISYLRQKKRMRFSDLTDQADDQVEEKLDLPMLSEQFTKQDILASLRELPSDYRIVFQLFALDDFSHKEIAQQLGILENASRARFFRAKKMIKEKLMALASNTYERRK